ncbi:hypothetical protein LOZ61_001977 [Ophidiomyces ophidiicola]|nr:hypothetical protein LOZ61_001977 [Ophidiomyces ophidiicola]KAI1957453.1 hypothetical protein LOZ59_003906 [Ophidiomyces ophidiicola]KAI2020444.1 hypothetical protein LOZ46_002831 [Ophidiomyces ophidiicola]KAI2029270.1 hypothetical protein LOZ45_001891 [Ophidiomyces ophidiicola]KAI2134592.1 hypothetical protein LOZ29_004202 [Ophidiomyces ophidiicola]
MSNNSIQGNPGQVPVLTTFVPSVTQDTPFRVSVHSWERPRPTRILESVMQPDDAVMYEMRVFIDGYCVSRGSLFNQRAHWPHVIDLSSQLDKNGDQDTLRFPPFHEEILRHTHWDAGEMYGRIRVVIAEGLARPNRSPPFERVRDIVIFSFQHAPLNILEHSNIAWPNAGMWLQGPRPLLQYSFGYEKALSKNDDAHSHSPSRPEARFNLGNIGPGPGLLPCRIQPTASTQWQNNPWSEGDPAWLVSQPPVMDPFVDPYRNLKQHRSTLDDVSMPDYPNSSTNSSRAISTNMSFGKSNQEPTAPASIDDEQYNQLIEALSPKRAGNGTCAPANTPASTTAKKTRLSEAAEARIKAARPGPLKEVSQPGSRLPSGSSIVCEPSPGRVATMLLSPSPNSIGKDKSVSPVPSGTSSISSGTHLKPTLPVGVSSDGKRKRSPKTDRKSIDSLHSASPTPLKKATYTKEQEGPQKENSTDILGTQESGASVSDVE